MVCYVSAGNIRIYNMTGLLLIINGLEENCSPLVILLQCKGPYKIDKLKPE